MQTFPESLKTIATTLVEYCKTGQEAKGLEELYHPDCVSVEALEMNEGCGREVHGVEGIKQKHAWWASAMEEHSSSVEGPFLHGDNRFSVIFKVDATCKESGKRQNMIETALYTIENGKIIREEFFYSLDSIEE